MRLNVPQGQSERVWKISPLAGIRYTDHPASSESLYRLSYPGPRWFQELIEKGLEFQIDETKDAIQ
jgi:hypothetical protein